MKQLLKYSLVFALAVLLNYVLAAQVTRVDAIGITVKDMNRSLPFYTDVLGFEKVSDEEMQGTSIEELKAVFGINIRVVRLKLGDEFIELTDYLTTGGRSIPEDQKSNDLSFQHIAIVVSDMEQAYQHLRKHNAEHVSTSPQTLPKSIPGAEGIKAFYFHDPDGHNLELIFFPKGKGQAKWQVQNGKLFLGVDHTAIGISNTSASHRFYSTLLGIERKGESFNKGTEQEHLNNVQGASLHITGYRSSAGPGVEFLQYLKPGPGRSYPPDTRADDLWFWQTNMITNDAEKLYKQLKTANYKVVSNKLIHQQQNGVHTKSFIVKDPDGHAVQITEYVIEK